MKLNGKHQRLDYAGDVNIFSGIVNTIKKNTEVLVVASKENVLEVNVEKKTKYMVIVSRSESRTKSQYKD